MGMSKALAEKIMIQQKKNTGLSFCATRYGNVLGSRGSIIPRFISQIKQNLPYNNTP